MQKKISSLPEKEHGWFTNLLDRAAEGDPEALLQIIEYFEHYIQKLSRQAHYYSKIPVEEVRQEISAQFIEIIRSGDIHKITLKKR